MVPQSVGILKGENSRGWSVSKEGKSIDRLQQQVGISKGNSMGGGNCSLVQGSVQVRTERASGPVGLMYGRPRRCSSWMESSD